MCCLFAFLFLLCCTRSHPRRALYKTALAKGQQKTRQNRSGQQQKLGGRGRKINRASLARKTNMLSPLRGDTAYTT